MKKDKHEFTSNCCFDDVEMQGKTTKYYVCKKCKKTCDGIANI